MTTITYGGLAKFLTDRGISDGAVMLADARYALPTEAWIPKLGAIVGSWLEQLGIKYQEEAFDCDNFSGLAATMAQSCWAVTDKSGFPSGLAFGLFAYTVRDNGGGHAINVAIHLDDSGKPYLAFYEPQPSAGAMSFSEVCLRRVELTQEEIESCEFCLFF